MALNERGGARIGMANVTWPFASLTVTREKLELKTAVMGSFVFRPGDIESIEPYGVLPLIGRGLKINHHIKTYKQKVIFWTFKNPVKLKIRIEKTGFCSNTDQILKTSEHEIIQSQKNGGFPIKPSAAIFMVVIWNLLFIADFIGFFKQGQQGSPLGLGVTSALVFVLAICILLLTTPLLQNLFLKPGRSLADIRHLVYFLMFICGFMLLTIFVLP